MLIHLRYEDIYMHSSNIARVSAKKQKRFNIRYLLLCYIAKPTPNLTFLYPKLFGASIWKAYSNNR